MRCVYIKYILQILCILSFISGTYAQKYDVRTMCSDYDKLLKSSETFHLPYVLSIASAVDTTTERLQVNLYKSGDKDYLKMGKMQEVIHDGTLLIIVNHEARMIRVGVDSVNSGSNHLLVSNFTSILDSSKNIEVHVKDGLIKYVLTFSPSYVYSNVELDFSKKTKNLNRVKAVFSKASRSEFRSLEVRYQEPDFKWAPALHFPNTDKYIVKSSNGKYIAHDAYDSYKLF